MNKNFLEHAWNAFATGNIAETTEKLYFNDDVEYDKLWTKNNKSWEANEKKRDNCETTFHKYVEPNLVCYLAIGNP